MGVRVTVVGGGSTYTPELVEGFVRRYDRLPVDELVLHDIDAERLSIVGGLADRMADKADSPTRIVQTTSRDEALDGADFVLIQLRVGGQAARLIDETLPPTFGTIGQETTGAGGLAKALRTVPVVLELAEEAARRAAPGAWILDFTNPVGIVTQALLDEGHRAIGLCNVAIGFQRDLAKRFGVEPERVQLEHVGLNHLTWERRVLVDGEDRLPSLMDTDAESIARQVRLPVELIRALRQIPSYYLRYFYAFPTVLEEQRSGHTRAQEVIDIERELLTMYRDPSLAEKPELLARRGGAHYSEAAARLDRLPVHRQGRHPGRQHPQRWRYARPAGVSRSGGRGTDRARWRPCRCPSSRWNPIERGLVQAIKAFEELAIKAAVTGDRAIALRALLGHPLIPGSRSRHRSWTPSSTRTGRTCRGSSRDRPGSRRQPRPDRASPRSVARPVVTAGAVRAARPSAPGGARSGAPPPA